MRGVGIIVGGILAVVLVLFGFYIWLALSWSYSDGERTGYLQKFSRKGWLCKTYEGELAMTTVPGIAPIVWDFTVRDEDAASKINPLLGQRVVLHYEEHRGLPTNCFGETAFFVDRIQLVDSAPVTPAPPASSAGK